MLMLDKLHRLGYEKLRWLSYMAPNGCALRCHITTADNIWCDWDVVNFDKEKLLAVSVGSFEATVDVDDLVKTFLNTFPSLANAGKGKDSRYRFWYKEILTLAKKGKVPEFNVEMLTVPLGKIRVDGDYFPAPPGKLRLISWNIDGLKAKWESLMQLIDKYSPDVVCLQKAKHSAEALAIPGFDSFISSSPYAGVCTYIRTCVSAQLDEAVMSNPNTEGYLQKFTIFHPRFSLFNCYAPYSNPKVSGAVDHRKIFNDMLVKTVSRTPDRLVLCGDMNIVYGKEDCWDGKFQRNQANFTDWEREDFNRLLSRSQLVDTYRLLNSPAKGFTYFFRNDPEVRRKNHGHRIDYFLASESFIPQIARSEIITDVTTSTNNPILLDIEY